MWPDRVSNLEPLALESDMLSTALHGPAERVLVALDSRVVVTSCDMYNLGLAVHLSHRSSH